MSRMLDIINKLEENPQKTYEEASGLLIKIAENILKDPSNVKLRTLQKANRTVSAKILNVRGGQECLKLMGFEESSTCFTIPIKSSLHMVELVKTELIKHRDAFKPNDKTSSRDQSSKESISKSVVESNNKVISQNPGQKFDIIKRIILPPFKSTFTNPFLKQIAFHFHQAQIYDNEILLERAKKLIPVFKLETAALKRLRGLQEQVKKGKVSDPEVSLQDMLILELLAWFKNDFFTWVDSPPCEKCNAETKFSHMSCDSDLLQYTDRVEMYKCKVCDSFVPFPRYSDLTILMETRRGRCGEWAHTFTFFCRAMKWDARQVFDETDHAWTEVYSFAQKRWLHCDPCENACDTPLVYELGWKKPISYVIAYSNDEVQDVTWRYSSNHNNVLKRRTKCTEEELINALLFLRNERQQKFSESKRTYLTKRLVEELCELLVEKKPNGNLQGRISGSLAWRLSRGDHHQIAEHVWTISDEDAEMDFVIIRYSTALDQYEQTKGSKSTSLVIEGWNRGVSKSSGLMRKEENDWKVVYLSRQENEQEGQITWKYTLESKTKLFDKVQIYMDYRLFETGKIEIVVTGDSHAIKFSDNQNTLETSEFSGSKTLTITAILSGGNGDIAWQHSQLFRQSSNSEHYPFKVILSFKDVM